MMTHTPLNYNKNKRIFDVVGVGSPILDIFINVDNICNPDINNLYSKRFIDHSHIKNFLDFQNDPSFYSVAGSAVNSLLGLDSLGLDTALIGQIGDDDNGRLFLQKMSSFNVNIEGVVSSQAPFSTTGLCFFSFDQNNEKIMSSFLGNSLSLRLSNSLAEIVKKGKIVYLEGYLWGSREGINLCKSVAKICKENNIRLAFNLSDTHIIEKDRYSLQSFVGEYVDIIFGNLKEYQSFFEKQNFNIENEYLSQKVSIICITKDKNGSSICYKGGLLQVPAYPTECVNSTGAGDLYVSGFLAAFLKGFDLYNSAAFANLVASKFISVPPNKKNIAIKNLAEIYGQFYKYYDGEKKCQMNTFKA